MLFGRRRPANPIIDFWAWWPDARPRLTATLAAGDGGMSMVEEISARVKAIHPELEWELSQGAVAQHEFTVSCAGNADLRAAAARWRALAPPADDTWEFHDSRQPNPDFSGATLRIDDRELSLGDTRFIASARGHAVDVGVFHPAYAGLPEGARTQIALLSLDWALGEQAVEVWVGQVSTATTSSADVFTVEAFRQLVTGIADQHKEPQWAMLTGEARGGRRIVATTQVPLRPARWPRFDTHVALTLPFEDRGNGLPTDAALQLLRDFEDSLTQLLEGDGELLAHETSQGIRTLHYYVDGDTEVSSRLAAAVSGWRKGRSSSAHDPALSAIRRFDADS